MTHAMNNREYEIIEQLFSGNWIVRDLYTGKIAEVSDWYLMNHIQSDLQAKTAACIDYLETGRI
jgi:hypothetical protein